MELRTYFLHSHNDCLNYNQFRFAALTANIVTGLPDVHRLV